MSCHSAFEHRHRVRRTGPFKRKLLPTSAVCAALALISNGQRAADFAPIRFRDVAAAAGVNFVLNHHPTQDKHMIETMPGGVATLDYDRDGLTDIYFTNGAEIPSLEKTAPNYWNRLFRNEGGLRFRDVTAEAGIAGAGYSMGVAAGDYDNDGNVDLFVAGVYRNLLYRNRADGRFEDVTTRAGIKSDRWSVAAGWFDYDNDGDLDLFVVNYAQWTLAFDRYCGDRTRNIRVYCHPKYFTPVANQLYRNRGDGTFEDVSQPSGIAAHEGRGMSVAFADYDGDGRTDIFVTNDNLPNFLFRNLGRGRFEEVALQAGVALLDHGRPVASMGADFRDYDNDGNPDITVTALTGETFPLFRNIGDGSFRDMTYASQIGSQSVRWSGWGNGFFDFNNDGWKDLFTANSHVNDRIELFEATTYLQHNTIFAGTRNGRFRDVTADSGLAQAVRAHRGAAFADFNNDGKLDVVVSCLGGQAELWENVTPNSNRWLILKLTGTKSNRDGIGARVRIGEQWNEMTTAVSYASSTHFGVHFGLGARKVIPEIEIRWPSGIVQKLSNVETNQTVSVREPD